MIRLLFLLVGYSALAQRPPIPPLPGEWVEHVTLRTNVATVVNTKIVSVVTVSPGVVLTNLSIEAVTTTNVYLYTNMVMRYPPALTRFAPATNLFRVTCPECGIERPRKAKRIEVVNYRPVPEGDIHDRNIFFVCCGQEFKAKNEKLVITPIAVEIKP